MINPEDLQQAIAEAKYRYQRIARGLIVGLQEQLKDLDNGKFSPSQSKEGVEALMSETLQELIRLKLLLELEKGKSNDDE